MRSLIARTRRRRLPVPVNPNDRLRPSRDVLAAEHEGSTVLLDLRRQVYLGVDEVGTTIWQAIERGATCAEIVSSLQDHYDAAPEVLQRDAQQFIAELQERRLVVVRGTERAPNLARCFVMLFVVDLMPRLFGMRSTLMMTRLFAPAGAGITDAALIRTTANRVALAAAFYPRRALCLEQSLALCLLLQRLDFDAVFHLGAVNLPFHAHAWTAVKGDPVNERAELTRRLATFPGFGG